MSSLACFGAQVGEAEQGPGVRALVASTACDPLVHLLPAVCTLPASSCLPTRHLQVESLRPRVITLLQRALLDNDDEVRSVPCLGWQFAGVTLRSLQPCFVLVVLPRPTAPVSPLLAPRAGPRPGYAVPCPAGRQGWRCGMHHDAARGVA